MAYIGKTPTVGNFQKCDAISVVNGQAAYTLQVGGSNVSPESPNHILVSLNGVLQAPTDSYTVSGATLTFASNLATGDVIDFVILLGNVLDLGVPSDGTVTNAKLAQDIISGETELAATPAGTDELLISDAGTLKRIDASFFQNTPAFGVRLSANQTGLADNVETLIEFDTEDFDTDSAFNTSTHTFTVPSGKGGLYFLSACLHFSHAGQINYNNTQIFKNGTKLRETQFNSSSGDYEDEDSQIITTVENLAAGDAITIKGNANSGDGTVTQVTGGSNTNHSFFRGFKLIGA